MQRIHLQYDDIVVVDIRTTTDREGIVVVVGYKDSVFVQYQHVLNGGKREFKSRVTVDVQIIGISELNEALQMTEASPPASGPSAKVSQVKRQIRQLGISGHNARQGKRDAGAQRTCLLYPHEPYSADICQVSCGY